MAIEGGGGHRASAPARYRPRGALTVWPAETPSDKPFGAWESVRFPSITAGRAVPAADSVTRRERQTSVRYEGRHPTAPGHVRQCCVGRSGRRVGRSGQHDGRSRMDEPRANGHPGDRQAAHRLSGGRGAQLGAATRPGAEHSSGGRGTHRSKSVEHHRRRAPRRAIGFARRTTQSPGDIRETAGYRPGRAPPMALPRSASGSRKFGRARVTGAPRRRTRCAAGDPCQTDRVRPSCGSRACGPAWLRPARPQRPGAPRNRR